MSCCINIALQFKPEDPVIQINNPPSSGVYQGAEYWILDIDDQCWLIYRELNELGCGIWKFARIKCDTFPAFPPGPGQILATNDNDCQICPYGRFIGAEGFYLDIVDCTGCINLQNRTERSYQSVKLPQLFEEEDRGFKKCCDCIMRVFANGGNKPWENDVNSAWIKLSDPNDTVEFSLVRTDGTPVTYIPTTNEFAQEPNAFYTTIPWQDVLVSDGIGCYKIVINYNIAGIPGTLVWGIYDLQVYNLFRVRNDARLKAVFNSYHEIEGIDFTGSEVVDTCRFYGYIGDRQTNTEIDNIIYQDREMKKVIRENLDTYEIKTDPIPECIMLRLTDLFLLSETELYVSDYNPHNHTYRLLDYPVIVEESPEIEYPKYARDAILTCTVGIKKKNRRSYF